MAKLTITREDLLRSKVVTPGWYRSKIVSVEESPAKTDGSLNTNVEFVIMQEGPFMNVPVTKTFSEKAPGFAVSFIEALIGRKIDESGGEFDLSHAVGREIDVFYKNDTWQNRLVNRAEDFRAVKA